MASENNNFDKLKENSDMITRITEQDEIELSGGGYRDSKWNPANWFKKKKAESGANVTMNAEAPQPTVVETPEPVAEEVPEESAVKALTPQTTTTKPNKLPGNRRRR